MYSGFSAPTVTVVETVAGGEELSWIRIVAEPPAPALIVKLAPPASMTGAATPALPLTTL